MPTALPAAFEAQSAYAGALWAHAGALWASCKWVHVLKVSGAVLCAGCMRDCREPTHHAPAGLALPAAPSAGANGDPFDMSKADEPKPCCGGFVDRSLRLLPRQLWFIMSFIVLLGIFMAFAVPSFLVGGLSEERELYM